MGRDARQCPPGLFNRWEVAATRLTDADKTNSSLFLSALVGTSISLPIRLKWAARHANSRRAGRGSTRVDTRSESKTVIIIRIGAGFLPLLMRVFTVASLALVLNLPVYSQQSSSKSASTCLQDAHNAAGTLTCAESDAFTGNYKNAIEEFKAVSEQD